MQIRWSDFPEALNSVLSNLGPESLSSLQRLLDAAVIKGRELD